MIKRNFWINKINTLWEEKNIIWLAGVRRIGKTCLCQSLDNIEFFDCELPRIRKGMEDPEGFLNSLKGKRIILDEIHKLPDPTEILKIAADHYPSIRIIATGSSVLSASTKFKDTLTGRKRELWLTPICSADLKDFGNENLSHRFLFGGFPGFFTCQELPEKDYKEWIDSYWSKDIQELFRLNRYHPFQKFMELLISQSGGIFEATRFAKLCELSRPTILNYLAVLEKTFVVHVIRPFNSHKPSELVSAPKVYGFDTGFVCFFKGWEKLRLEDMGTLWEHFVLNEIYSNFQNIKVNYWRNKQCCEIDFVVSRRSGPPIAIECKWSSSNADLKNLHTFAKLYPSAELFVVANDLSVPFLEKIGNYRVKFLTLPSLVKELDNLLKNV